MQDMAFWKAILLTLVIIAMAVFYVFVTSLLGFDEPWVAFVAVTVWSAIGMKLEQAPGIFIGSAVGLLITYGIDVLPELYGEAAVILPVLAIVLAIACKIKEMFPLVCNFGLFMFLTIGSSVHFFEQRLQLEYLQNLAIGALCFWIIPWLILKVRSGQTADG
ncbi:DUF1097 family protein [Ruegeria pomeroyi]|nr:DUF1097 family protein [Ruegeria pomeroyi]MCE8534639.1 DUF1097 family protein [Ruegeria pomeroyi]